MSIFPPRPRRIKGHALKMEWSGEYGVESSSTGFCKCGWEESASSQNEVRNEYGFHLSKVQQFAEEGVTLDFEGPLSYSPWFVEQSPKGTVAMSANATITVEYQGKTIDLEPHVTKGVARLTVK